jgi:hypothetical protein
MTRSTPLGYSGSLRLLFSPGNGARDDRVFLFPTRPADRHSLPLPPCSRLDQKGSAKSSRNLIQLSD